MSESFGNSIFMYPYPLTGAVASAWQAMVIGDLYMLDRSKTGKCALNFINAQHRSVTIMPFVGEDKTMGPKNAYAHPSVEADASLRGRPLRDANYGSVLSGDGAGAGTGTGTWVFVHYTPWRFASAWNRPTTLLHELTHACEQIEGVQTCNALSWYFDTQAEFDAILVENIYRSEKGIYLRRNHHGEDRLKGDMVPQSSGYRKLVNSFRIRSPRLAHALAQVDVPFNPLRKGAKGFPAAGHH